MALNLRAYQQAILHSLTTKFREGYRRMLIQAPTGSGKGAIISYLSQNSTKNTLVLTHRKELKKDLENRGARAGMVETFYRRNEPYPEILILDECHLSNFDKIIENAPKDITILGFTATPVRTGKQKPLDSLYETIIKGPHPEELIEQGHVVPTINYGYSKVQNMFENAPLTAGDYDIPYQTQMYAKLKIYEGVVENYLLHTKNKKAIFFTPDTKSSDRLAELFREAGIEAYSVSSKSSQKERLEIFEGFINNKFKVLINCNIATTGFDCPDIEVVGIVRATTSLTLYNQMVGRGVRTYPGKTHCVVLDFGENVQRFGFWEDEREWTLHKKIQSKKEGVSPVKLCPKCDRMNKPQNPTCVHCGFMFPVKIVIPEKVTLEEIVQKKKIGWYLYQCTTEAEAIEVVTKQFGYKKGWWYMNRHRYIAKILDKS